MGAGRRDSEPSSHLLHCRSNLICSQVPKGDYVQKTISRGRPRVDAGRPVALCPWWCFGAPNSGGQIHSRMATGSNWQTDLVSSRREPTVNCRLVPASDPSFLPLFTPLSLHIHVTLYLEVIEQL